LVEPQPEEPLLAISLAAMSDESSRYELNAFFRRGTDARGHPVELVDRALYVEGTPVVPGPERTPGIWSYRWQETRVATGAHADSVRVAFPVIATSSSGAHSITIPVTRRVDPADVDLVRGEDLVLRVSSADGATAGLTGGVDFWTLDIRQSCVSGSGRQFTITGTGPHPSELRVPWRWLEALPVGSVAACFRSFWSFQVAGSPYQASVTVSVQLAWRIHVVGPAM
jgi:hypothetical protein